MALEQKDEAEAKRERRYDKLAMLGLAIAVFGTLLQAWSTAASPKTPRFVPADDIATAIAAARGALLIALRLGKVSIAERPESRGGVRYDGSTTSSSTVACEL
jgi:hypothetical protein